jgi:hypothetical protein
MVIVIVIECVESPLVRFREEDCLIAAEVARWTAAADGCRLDGRRTARELLRGRIQRGAAVMAEGEAKRAGTVAYRPDSAGTRGRSCSVRQMHRLHQSRPRLFRSEVVGAQRSDATEQIRFLSLAARNECHPCLHDELNYPPFRQAGGMLTILKQLSPQTLLPVLAARSLLGPSISAYRTRS